MPLWSLFITEETKSGAGKYLVPGLHSSEVAEPDGDLDGLRTDALSQVSVGPFIPLFFKTVTFHCSHSIFELFSPVLTPFPSPWALQVHSEEGALLWRQNERPGCKWFRSCPAWGSLWDGRGKPASGVWKEAVCGWWPWGTEARQSRAACRTHLHTHSPLAPPPASNTHTLTCSLWVAGSGPQGLWGGFSLGL